MAHSQINVCLWPSMEVVQNSVVQGGREEKAFGTGAAGEHFGEPIMRPATVQLTIDRSVAVTRDVPGWRARQLPARPV